MRLAAKRIARSEQQKHATTVVSVSRRFDFDRQRVKGESIEEKVRAWIADGGKYWVEKATRKEQSAGIDCWVNNLEEDERHSLEIKADWTASKTGNVFVETVSVSTKNIPGWAYSSKADWLIYVLPAEERLFCIRFDALRKHLSDWVAHYPRRQIPNRDYFTEGHLVPLVEFEKIVEFEGVLPE